MPSRFRYSVAALMTAAAIVAGVLAFWRTAAPAGWLALVPVELLAVILTIILATAAVMVFGAFRR